MKSSFFWLSILFLCIPAIGENITLSSNHGSFTFEVEDVSDHLVDQIFWENFELLFPGYYYTFSTVSVSQPSPTHYHFTLIIVEEASPCLVNQKGIYRCQFCNKETRHRRTMYDHIRLHNGVRMHCSTCGEEFNSAQAWSKHHKKH